MSFWIYVIVHKAEITSILDGGTNVMGLVMVVITSVERLRAKVVP